MIRKGKKQLFLPSQTDPCKERESICVCVRAVEVVQRFSPRAATLSSLCPVLIHLPSRYYRDAAQKNADRQICRRPGLNLNNKWRTHNTAKGGCYIMPLQQQSAVNLLRLGNNFVSSPNIFVLLLPQRKSAPPSLTSSHAE